MKRMILSVLLILVLLFSLSGCVVQLGFDDHRMTSTSTSLQPDNGTTSGSGVSQSSVSQSTTSTSAPVSTGGSVATLSRDEAKNIAYQNAGVTAAEVRDLEIELDRDDGVLSYEIEFNVGRTEYKYDIHAQTGKILEKDIDRND